MDVETAKMYIELVNGILGICILLVTLSVFRFTSNNPELIKSYFFRKNGTVSKPFIFFMVGMHIWGIKELYKVLEIREIIRIDLFYEILEFFSALLLFISILYFFLKLTKMR